MHPPAVNAYLTRVGAEPVNFRRAIIKIFRGHYYHERAVIKINPDGKVTSSIKEFSPTEEEAKAMKIELAEIEFPKTIKARNTNDLKIHGETFEFIDRKDGFIIMVQERRIHKNGTKSYLPWVMLSTGDWAQMEPDGGLPFWKPPIRLGPGARIMIHEGAKAAAKASQIATSKKLHPWKEELELYEHWGMIGGALAPQRTDYKELSAEAPKEVVYVCDRDQPGEAALQKVSAFWGKRLKGIKFGDQFPETWDVADEIPPTLFKRGRYLGPKLKELMKPATWATEMVQTGNKGRPSAMLKYDFASEWLHCIRPEVFIHRDWPSDLLSASEFNSLVAPFSNVDDTARLLRKDDSSKNSVLKYDPSLPPGVYGGRGHGHFINTHSPPNIIPEDGDSTPWLEFMKHLTPDDADRLELERWCATIIARPDIRIHYGVLLISETQGVGKGTLGEKILAPLVGAMNTSYPSENEIVDSNFNYWLAHKRLAVVHEIYAGHSSKAYNKLKSTITDKFITVSRKYLPNYEIENWVHIFACSNSKRAIKLSMDDRRWFVPMLTEKKRSAKYWETLNCWLLDEGGLEIISHWASTFLESHSPVFRGVDAPWSKLKREIVEEGYSPGQELISQTLVHIKDTLNGEDKFTTDTDLVNLIKQIIYDGRHSDKLERRVTVRAVAKAAGWFIGKTRCTVKAWGPNRHGARIVATSKATAEAMPGDLCNEKMPEDTRQWPLDLTKFTQL